MSDEDTDPRHPQCERCGKTIAFPLNEFLTLDYAKRPHEDPTLGLENWTEVHLCSSCGEDFESFLATDPEEAVPRE